jgi:CHAT domain-containing protein
VQLYQRQWLAQRFVVNYVTSIGLTNFDAQNLGQRLTAAQGQPRVLAAAVSQGNFTLQSGNRTLEFNALPFVREELAAIAETLDPEYLTKS